MNTVRSEYIRNWGVTPDSRYSSRPACWSMRGQQRAPACSRGFLPSILVVLMVLKDRVALITGSGRGIGRAIAQLFAKEGAAVFLTARTEKELASAAREIADAGGRAGYATADLSREADGAQVVATAREKFGHVDILVNNAGHYGPV